MHSTATRSSKRNKSEAFITWQRDRANLLNAMRDARLNAGLSQEALAYLVKRSQAAIANEESDERTDRTASILKVYEICKTCESIEPVKALGRTLGAIVVPIPDMSPDMADVHEQVSRVLKAVGEAIGAVGEAISDQKVTLAELARCTKEIDEAIESLVAMKAILEARTGRGL